MTNSYFKDRELAAEFDLIQRSISLHRHASRVYSTLADARYREETRVHETTKPILTRDGKYLGKPQPERETTLTKLSEDHARVARQLEELLEKYDVPTEAE